MGDRVDDLRGWWGRTRRRTLKPGVQTWLGRVRPTATGTSSLAPEPEALPSAPEAGPEPEAGPRSDVDIAPAPEAGPEPEALPSAPEAGPEPEAGSEPEPEPEPAEPAASLETQAAVDPDRASDLEPTADPWAAVTWSSASDPAPWWGETADAAGPEPVAADAEPSPADPGLTSTEQPASIIAAAPEPPPHLTPPDASLDLDDDQRRWLGRRVELVEGIGPAYGRALEAVGIVTLQDLLLRGATRRGRQEIADRTGISGKLVLRWVNNADLFRIRGVGTQYADLLEAAGVDTVVELALRRPDNLALRLKTTNDVRGLAGQVPTESQVAAWIAHAKELPRIVAY